MKTITREHLFERRLNYIEQGRKYYYLWHEKDIRPIRILRTSLLDRAFKNGLWSPFIIAEAKSMGCDMRSERYIVY